MLQTIRQRCHNWHEQLHQHPLLAPLSSGALSFTRYGLILTAFHRVYTNLEQHNECQLSEEVPNAPAVAWLEADMARHRLEPMRDSKSIGLTLPIINSVSRMFGYLYVKQGSTLGGQVISKVLEAKLGLKPGIDNMFFHGYGSATGANWKKFLAHFESASRDLDENETIETAIAVFQGIDKACSQMLAKEKR